MKVYQYFLASFLALAFFEIFAIPLLLVVGLNFDTVFLLSPIYVLIWVFSLSLFAPRRTRRFMPDISPYLRLPPLVTEIWAYRFRGQIGPDEIQVLKMDSNATKIWLDHVHDFPKVKGIELFKIKDNRTEWYKDGLLHNEVGPAVIQKLGSGSSVALEEWWFQGVRHRDNGPSSTVLNNKSELIYQSWQVRGKFHRKDGPAIIRNGAKEWWTNGVRHRWDGPAIEYEDGSKEWIYQGVEIEPMELFELLTPEEQDKVIWELNTWK